MAMFLGVILNLAFLGFLVFAVMGIFRKPDRKRHFKIGGLGMLACFVGFALLSPLLPDDIDTTSNSPTEAADHKTPSAYTITRDESLGSMKRTVEVILDRRVSETELTSIAKEIKAMDRKPYERVFISYDLKGTSQDDIGMSYAISHYTPDLDINFLGLSTDEEKIIWTNIDKLESETVTGDIIGRWVKYGQDGTVLVIEKIGSTYHIHEVWPKVTTSDENWGPITYEATAVTEGNTTRFFMEWSGTDEWYKLYSNGDLRFQSDLGSDNLMPKATRP